MFCPQCGNSNDNAKFCTGCGFRLAANEGAVTYGEDEFFKAVIGPKNQDYYMRRFHDFKRNGKAGISWHWQAFFITFYWLLYRKMWLNAFIYFLTPYLALILMSIISALSGDAAGIVMGIGYLLCMAGIFILPPLYANALYYRHCRKKIAEAKASPGGLERQLGELAAKGGTSNIAIIIIIMVLVITSIIGILAAIAIPAYADYRTRAALASAVSVGSEAAGLVANYIYENSAIPGNLQVAGFKQPLPAAVQEMRVDAKSGVITITMAQAPLTAKSLFLVPTLDESKQIIWKCASQDIPERYLPLRCRPQQ